MTDPGPGYARTINNHGEVLISDGSSSHVRQAGVRTDLNTLLPDGRLRADSADSINDHGATTAADDGRGRAASS